MAACKLGAFTRGLMRNRRREERKSLMAYTQVFDLYGGLLIGYLNDLTLTGAMVIGEKEQEVHAGITLAMELPELAEVNASRITLPSRVVWCEQDISPQFFNIGFEFTEVDTKQKKIIELIIRNYQFQRDTPNYPPRTGPLKGLS